MNASSAEYRVAAPDSVVDVLDELELVAVELVVDVELVDDTVELVVLVELVVDVDETVELVVLVELVELIVELDELVELSVELLELVELSVELLELVELVVLVDDVELVLLVELDELVVELVVVLIVVLVVNIASSASIITLAILSVTKLASCPEFILALKTGNTSVVALFHSTVGVGVMVIVVLDIVTIFASWYEVGSSTSIRTKKPFSENPLFWVSSTCRVGLPILAFEVKSV